MLGVEIILNTENAEIRRDKFSNYEA